MIKAVVFDYGKVICHPPPDSKFDDIAAIAGVSRDAIEPLLWKHRHNYDNGKLSAIEYYRVVLNDLNITLDNEGLCKIRDADFFCWTSINEETVRLMGDIKRSGLVLGILSNMPFDFLRYARKRYPVMDMAHVAVYSCNTGVVKPEKAIYNILLERINLRAACLPREVVFFDDMPENVAAARDAKINAVVWESCAMARDELKRLGVKLDGG